MLSYLCISNGAPWRALCREATISRNTNNSIAVPAGEGEGEREIEKWRGTLSVIPAAYTQNGIWFLFCSCREWTPVMWEIASVSHRWMASVTGWKESQMLSWNKQNVLQRRVDIMPLPQKIPFGSSCRLSYPKECLWFVDDRACAERYVDILVKGAVIGASVARASAGYPSVDLKWMCLSEYRN
jgi:hypothetical protein